MSTEQQTQATGLPDSITDEAAHNAAMLSAVAQSENTETPEFTLPEGINSVDELIQRFNEQSLKAGGLPDQPQEDDTEEDDEDEEAEDSEAEDSEESDDEDADDIDEQQALDDFDFSDYAEEFADNGALTEESRNKIQQELGIKDEQLFDAFLDGIKAQVDDVVSAAYKIVGSKEQYEKVIEWAQENLTEAQAEAFDRTIEDGNFDSFTLQVEGLKARYNAANGSSTGNELSGKPAPTNGGVFESTAQLSQAIADPRYHSDPAFRRTVEQKLQRSMSNF